MINRKYFKIKPQSWLCPHCGEWHEYKGDALINYSKKNPLELYCTRKEWKKSVIIYVEDDFATLKLGRMCWNIEYSEEKEIPITKLDDARIYGFFKNISPCERCCNSEICNIYENRIIYQGSFNYQFFVKFAIKFS